jgi:hypothetical protein
MTNSAEQPAPKSKRMTKLDRLRAQGHWDEIHLEGKKVPHFAMPTAELQTELNEELEKKIRKRLRDDGFERICATRREHPFHSNLFRERMDDLVGDHGSAYKTEESTERARQETYTDIEKLAALKAASGTPYDVEAEKHKWDEHVERGRKDYVKRYAEGVETYRSMLREPLMWRGTRRYLIMFPPNGPALPNEPLPKPVYISKQSPDRVIQLQDGFVNLYAKVGA